MDQYLDERFMRLALEEAKEASSLNEVPVGAVLVDKNHNIISKAHNLRESTQNPLAHAEVLAIEEASKKLGRWRLIYTSLYVTLEPCVMCMGAIINSRVERVVFGAADPKAGGLISKYNIGTDNKLNHHVKFTKGILHSECSKIIKDFFQIKR